MTSYVYNPSKKVTELLSQYLEFDPEELQLGIWSGNLSLNNVNLRQDAIHPLLNRFLNSNGNSATSKNLATTLDLHDLDTDLPQQQDYVKPPLRFKLVSGKIGSLSMRIPWKRLVWGQGDVAVDLRNIVIVLALESRIDTEDDENEQNAESHTTFSYYPEEYDKDAEDDSSQTTNRTSRSSVHRGKKQTVIREAERRLVHGRSIGPWLKAMKKKEEEERAKKQKGQLNTATVLKEHESRTVSWLRSMTSDFFWRFCAGLQMNVENVKIVIVQDGIEVGIIMPSNKVIPSKLDKEGRKITALRAPFVDEDQLNINNVSNNVPESMTATTPPQNLVYEGEYDDGEHVDKKLKQVGIGIFVRRSMYSFAQDDDYVPLDAHTNDYILRPVDVDFDFSLFFPLPEDRRKRKVEQQRQLVEDHSVTSVGEDESTTVASSENTSKRRRGKRDRDPLLNMEATADTTQPTLTSSPVPHSNGPLYFSPRRRTATADLVAKLSPLQARRMSTIGVTTMSSLHHRRGSIVASNHSSDHNYAKHSRHATTTTLPLAQPDDIGKAYATTTRSEVTGIRSARFDGKLSVGAVQIICSTSHYELVNIFLAGCSKMRNGRPRKTIRSVLEKQRQLEFSENDMDGSSIVLITDLIPQKEHIFSEKEKVVRSWWRYVFGVLFWELRQRKRLRRIFKQMYLSFNWERQSYRRSEYVKLYIMHRLNRTSSTAQRGFASLSGYSSEAELLTIEDELAVEQILLYRSLARAVHVLGKSEMPHSILELRRGQLTPTAEYETHGDYQKSQDNRSQIKMDDLEEQDHVVVSDGMPTFLTKLEERCEVARKRLSADDNQKLPEFLPLNKRWMSYERGRTENYFDEVSYGFMSETKTIKTHRSSKSKLSVASTAMETIGSHEKVSTGMLFSFSAKLEKLEAMIVEDEKISTEFHATGLFSPVSAGESVGGSSNGMSEVSVLTDDERFFREGGDQSLSGVEETETTDPVFPSTDYLLFKTPERVLLKIEIASLLCSTLGRSGGSRNINFSIGKVTATGDGNLELLTIGCGGSSQEIPFDEIQFPRGSLRSISKSQTDMPSDALSMSIVDKNNQSFLQCDTPIVRAWCDLLTFQKLYFFFSTSTAIFPQQLLAKTPREAIRLYVLQQNENSLSSLNCSIRMHGFEFAMPLSSTSVSHKDDNDQQNHSKFPRRSAALFRCDIVEIYSGTAVADLCETMETLMLDNDSSKYGRASGQRNQIMQTRRLGMLDVPRLLALNSSLLSSHWVIATSGLDVNLVDEDSNHRSLFKNPFDIEILYTENSDSLLDFNRAKQEVVVEVSPLHLLISEERMRLISRLDPQKLFLSTPSNTPASNENFLPPRLDVLSNFLRQTWDVSVGRILISFFSEQRQNNSSPTKRQVIMESSMCDFLNLVSRFDLSFPHEDALSAAMQVCIDRLTGIGLPLEESWEATNLVLLNFLEDIAEARKEEESENDGTTIETLDQKMVQRTILLTSKRTVEMYSEDLIQETTDADPFLEDLLIDIPDGIAVAYAKLFYDDFLCVGVPTLFVANGDGIQLIRVTPSEKNVTEVSNARSQERSSISDSDHFSVKEDSEAVSNSSGVSFQRFSIDRDYHFGRGGHPLAILGTDMISDGADERHKETLNDIELGDLEILFSCCLAEDCVKSLLRISAPFPIYSDYSMNDDSERDSKKTKPSVGSEHILSTGNTSFTAACSSVSALCLSDCLAPFTRLVLSSIISRSGATSVNDNSQRGKNATKTGKNASFVVDAVSLLNLTSEGELFPAVVSVLPDHVGPCLSVYFNGEIVGLEVLLKGLRVIFLRQFLNEFLQYFLSGQFGLGRFLSTVRNSRPQPEKESALYTVRIEDSSLILPKSTSSYDLLCIEFDETVISSKNPVSSFVVPTAGCTLDTCDCISDLDDNFSDKRRPTPEAIHRTKISMNNFRIFCSLPEQVVKQSEVDSPSFRFFFAMDGRAAAGKQVYCSVGDQEGVVEAEDAKINSARAKQCWQEITTKSSSLNIFVDYAPHMRLLITDETYSEELGGLELDLKLSQFCLMLSVWFSNMQELPMMFPYSAAHLESAARYLQPEIPEYGSQDFQTFLATPLDFTSEVAIVLRKLSMRMAVDVDDDDRTEMHGKGTMQSTKVVLEHVVVHVTNDRNGIARIGTGSSAAIMNDESFVHSSVLELSSQQSKVWADLEFGLKESRAQLSKPLPQAFQMSIFMVPGWTIYNLGMENAKICLVDFDPIFKFLHFVSAYFSDGKYGNPSFDAEDRVEKIKKELLKLSGQSSFGVASNPKSNNLDFRLWLRSPTLRIPIDSADKNCAMVELATGSGLWYKYLSLEGLQSHEVVADTLCLSMLDSPLAERFIQNGDGKTPLIENLSFGLRMDTNIATEHTDFCVKIPFTDETACSHTSQRLSCPPKKQLPPTICIPYDEPVRSLGPVVAEMTFVVEVLPMAYYALLNLFSASSSNDDTSASVDGFNESRTISAENSASSISETKDSGTFSAVADIGDLRLFVLDPVLGPHLPVAVLSVSSVLITASQFSQSNVLAKDHSRANPDDMQISFDGHLWADYFKLGLTRSWEPLMEAYRFHSMYERSKFRGSGLALESDSPLHLNVSSALLVILDEVIDVLNQLIFDPFGTHAVKPVTSETGDINLSRISTRLSIEEDFAGHNMIHEKPIPLIDGDRVAFSLRNMTGQKIRIFRADRVSDSNVLTYLDHDQSAKLSFLPSISVIKNMKVTEVEYPGLSGLGDRKHAAVPPHSVSMQLPGFHWLNDIPVDTFGRSFANLVPRSPDVAGKISDDWRLANILKVLIEVGLDKGGRQVTARSLISVVNRSNHDLNLILNPDPTFKPHQPSKEYVPGEEDDKIEQYPLPDLAVESGSSVQIPTILFDSALRQPGSHLGSVWMRPHMSSSESPAFESFLLDTSPSPNDLAVDYCSRPLQLAKIVSESAAIYEEARGRDLSSDEVKSGMQLSCPVARRSGKRLAPFCYAIEIGRSPIVQAPQNSLSSVSKKSRKIHGPVAYTLSIHPPFVISNLLPEKGRFELMHAVHRRVLWFGDLDPGQQIAVHSVGLDAPLLLFLNLGFAKTPVGEGALVHHGTDPQQGTRENLVGLKSIGKAGKAVTKQIGKTLTSMGESPDQRGLHRVALAQNPHQKSLIGQKERNVRVINAKTDLGMDADVTGIDEVDGKTYKIDTFQFFPHDVVDETQVVDGLGQRLPLNIENVRGGGGQRRISVFCRFWIINTTEHCLRYKQENSKLFVSGTVLSPDKDGSLPLSGGRSKAKYESLNEGQRRDRCAGDCTIFSGKPGALATSAGRCEKDPEKVTALLDRHLPMERLARLAFMFNFHEAVMTIGHQRLCVQLGDGTGHTSYESDWSRGFSLESVGISQIVSLHCKDGRALELNVIVNVAPGHLATYSKIVRFLPRYVAVNTLPYPVRIWQDSSVFRPALATDLIASQNKSLNWRSANGKRWKDEPSKINQYESLWGRETRLDVRESSGPLSAGTAAHGSALYITTLFPNEILPFCLPDSRGERQIRIDVGKPWNLTASVSSDIPGDHVLKVKRSVDLRVLPHVSTRSNPKYEIRLPPNNSTSFSSELGVWFETEWGSSQNLIVKAVKRNSYAFNETDVHVGDELMAIDGIPVSRMSFSDAMNFLRLRLREISKAHKSSQKFAKRHSLKLASRSSDEFDENDSGGELKTLVLTFRTVEERLRMVRLKAAKASRDYRRPTATGLPHSHPNEGTRSEQIHGTKDFHINAELKTVPRTDVGMLLLLKDTQVIPFQIQNQSIRSTLYFRQRGCSRHSWQFLPPGQSTSYTWDEPLRPRRLVVRVALNSSFQYTEEETNNHLPDSVRSIGTEHERRRKKPLFRKLKEEEDTAFSPSINVRLEEIGYCEYLSITNNTSTRDALQSTMFLKLTVDVEGATRILTVQDATVDEDEKQMIQHLDYLQTKLKTEETRLRELTLLNVFPGGKGDCEISTSTDYVGVEVASKKLVEDILNDSTITGRHQIVVEVLEAIGLSPDSFITSCNPYAEVRLKTTSPGRKSLFHKKDLRRTYFVRKSTNPTWIGQSFVFEVPKNAASVTRGNSVHVSIRSYRQFGSHQKLGRAQVDLHSVRHQEPLEGWFPLSGRTGRLELENQQSHWGRGSIKLRVQWVYTTPALVHYFILLSESRLSDLQECHKGMAEHLRRKREADRREKVDIDGFRPVRIQELLSLSNNNTKLRAAQIQKQKRLNTRVVKKLIDPLRSVHEKSHKASIHGDVAEPEIVATEDGMKSSDDLRMKRIRSTSSSDDRNVFHRASFSSHDVMERLEDRIIRQRKIFQRLVSNRSRFDKRSAFGGESGIISVSTFKFWSSIQAIFNDDDFEIKVLGSGSGIRILLRDKKPAILEESCKVSSIFSSSPVARKLDVSNFPIFIRSSVEDHIQDFIEARDCFERSAKLALRTVLNPGGWLTIRPMTALNLSDAYTGMFVKVLYGSELLTTETTDSRVTPTWYKENVMFEDRQRQANENFLDNDLHIHVAPQKTSGSIRLSVVGERRHQKLQSKTELGVVHLPLGTTIAACIDAQINKDKEISDYEQPMYVRWFPLTNPRDAIQVEGDRGLRTRPPESEKINDNLFRDYFAPCIQLALSWLPDSQEHVYFDNAEELQSSSSTGVSVQSDKDGRNQHTLSARSYFNADIGRVSLALIDSHQACELLSLSVADIDIRYLVTKAKTRMGLTVGWLQLDYQGENVREPVVLAPTPTDSLLPVLQTIALKDNIRSSGDVMSFDFIDLSLVEFDLTVEENLLFDLFEFFSSIRHRKGVKHLAKSSEQKKQPAQSTSHESQLLLRSGNNETRAELLSFLSNESDQSSEKWNKMYIRQLFLGIVKINLSYLKGKRASRDLSTASNRPDKRLDMILQLPATELLMEQLRFHRDSSNLFVEWSQRTFDEESGADEEKGIHNFPAVFASLFPNLSDAPIRLPGKALNHVFESPIEIMHSIRKFYVNEILKQVYKIVGSLDFVGNPTMLVSSFFSGVRDLVVAPSSAFLKSPTDPSRVGIGVAKGTLSFFSHSTSGFFGVLAKVSAVAGQGVAYLSLDSDFSNWHRDKVVVEATNLNREYKRRGVQNAGLVVGRPILDLLIGVTGAISGIFISPVMGYRHGGKLGLARGVAIGGIGLLAKPTVGMLDALTHFASSIHDIAKSVNVLDRRLQPALKLRLPYTFGMMSILSPFDEGAARASSLLKEHRIKAWKQSSNKVEPEAMVHFEVLPSIGSQTFAILSNLRVLLIRLTKETSGVLTSTLCWELLFSKDATISSRLNDHGHSGVALTLLKRGQDGIVKEIEKDSMQDSPLSGGDSIAASQTMGLSTPEDGISSTLSENKFDHGAGRDSEGDLLEWFTIVAEYSCRRQLTRFHNAVSCVTGNFEDIIYDPAVRTTGKTEGCTSFGMFYFERETGQNDESSKDIPAADLDNMSWVWESMFQSARRRQSGERKRYLSGLRHNWDFDQELEASRNEDGPEWLVIARARAIFVDQSLLLTPYNRSERPVSSSIQRKPISYGDHNGLPTICDEEDEGSDLIEMSESNDVGENNQVSDLDLSEDTFSDPLDTKIAGSGEFSDFKRPHLSETKFFSTPLLSSGAMQRKSDFSELSFRTAVMSSTKGGKARSSSQIFGNDEIPSGVSDSNEFNASPTMRRKRISTLSSVSNDPPSLSNTTNEKRNGQGKVDRMDRMESLLERLLIFSSEQALQRERPLENQYESNEVAALRREVEDLRSQIEVQQKTGITAEEVEKFRKEIASLREQLCLPSRAADIFQSARESTSSFIEDIEDIEESPSKPEPELID